MRRSNDDQREPESVRGSGHFEKSFETLSGPEPQLNIQTQREEDSEEAWGEIDD
ncbi:hypothetical protein [Nocardia sp. NPDC003979]